MKLLRFYFTFFLLICFSIPLTAVAAPVNIPDPNLRAAIETVLGKQAGDPITVADMADLTSLTARNANISDLTGLEHATNLTDLTLASNSISDISAVSGLTNLTFLDLYNNSISDISSLVANTGLGNGNWVYVQRNPLNYPSIHTHIPTLQSRGVEVRFNDRTPTTLLRISGTITESDNVLIVEVRDGEGQPFAGVPVTFTVTEGGGTLSRTSTTTNENGRAESTLTLGASGDRNTVRASVEGISETVTFRDVPESTVDIPDSNLRAAIETALNKQVASPITEEDMENLTNLQARQRGIRVLAGLEYATNLTTLVLADNSISDISALAELTNLATLVLADNSISDISALAELTNLTSLELSGNGLSDGSVLVPVLSGLTNLTELNLSENGIKDISTLTGLTNLTDLNLSNNSIADISSLAGLTNLTDLNLSNNSIVDISPLVANTVLGNENVVFVERNPLSYSSLHTHIPTLENRGVRIEFTPRTPTALVKISGTITESANVLVVEVRDSQGEPFSGVPVMFTVTAGGGTLTNTSTTTDLNGRAESTLTLETDDDTNTVSASVEGISGTVTFSDVPAGIHIPEPSLRTAIENALNKQAGDPITEADIATLTDLKARQEQIRILNGLEFATNLTELNLGDNSISDIAPLANLTNLTSLFLDSNSIADISPLMNLTELTSLDLNNNSISDISSLAGLTNLRSLGLSGNNLSDVSALIPVFSRLTNLTSLFLSDNSIADISPLAGLTNLTSLFLSDNSIADISPLAGLINLTSLFLDNNLIADISPLVSNTRLGSGDTVNVEQNLLSYPSIYTYISILGARRVQVYFDNRTPTTLEKISGDTQEAESGTALSNPFVVEVRDANGVVFEGVPVTFAVTAGGGTLSVEGTETDKNGRAESTLTLGADGGTNTVRVSVEGISEPVTFNAESEGSEFDLSLPSGINLIHVPLKVKSVDGVSKTIKSVGDLYDALGGAATVSLLITYDPNAQRWDSYLGARDKGKPADKALTDDLGIITSMKAPASIRLSGDALGTNGSSSITLHPGTNLVGVPLKDSRIARVSDLFSLEGIGDNVVVIIVSDNGEFKVVARSGDAGDVEITGGQSFILTAREAATVIIEGDGWANAGQTTVAPPIVLTGIQANSATPVLAVTGSIVISGPVGGKSLSHPFRVTVKNLSTGKVDMVVTDDRGGYQLTFVDLETGRVAQIGDTLEITAQSPDAFVGVQPLRHTVTAEDVSRNWITVTELVAYEIPAKTELLLNYPNPFNPETWIPYRLANDSDVTLTIYNTKGAVVRRLDLGHQSAGFYTARAQAAHWNGRNASGESVASGVYFYQLRADDYSALRQMVIVK